MSFDVISYSYNVKMFIMCNYKKYNKYFRHIY